MDKYTPRDMARDVAYLVAFHVILFGTILFVVKSALYLKGVYL